MLGVWEAQQSSSATVQALAAVPLPPLTREGVPPSIRPLEDPPLHRRRQRRYEDKEDLSRPARRRGAEAAGPLDVAGFVCGLLGVVFFCIPLLARPLGLSGIIFSVAGMSQTRGRQPSWQTIAGAILGTVAMLLGTLTFLAVFGEHGRNTRF